jgi:hypothetical protein
MDHNRARQRLIAEDGDVLRDAMRVWALTPPETLYAANAMRFRPDCFAEYKALSARQTN